MHAASLMRHIFDVTCFVPLLLSLLRCIMWIVRAARSLMSVHLHMRARQRDLPSPLPLLATRITRKAWVRCALVADLEDNRLDGDLTSTSPAFERILKIGN